MYLSVSKEVAMTVSGLVLITVCLANVLAVEAECCKCDCHGASNSGLHHSQLYYIPVVPSHQSTVHLGGQHLAAVSLANIAHIAQEPPTQHADYQGAGHYHVAESDSEESSDIGGKIQGNAGGLDYHSGEQRQSYSYGESEHLDASDSSNTEQLSKVSTHLDTHYINIEKKIVSEQNSIKDVDHLGDEKDDHHHHHHGKDDYYKFEYAVNDEKTHDIKRHKEEKKGDVVQGEYSLVEDDGNVRTVKYYADWKTGFHAQVHNSKKTALR